uniref:RraA family protein n=1 Tax=Fervidobacterium pennivorans TaxID=93466 RepID=A0A7V4KCB8_FERPE
MGISEKRRKLLELYSDIRVADVRDALDAFGYHFHCTMDTTIKPLFRTRAFGIAKTVRYLPYRGGNEYAEYIKDPKRYLNEYLGKYYQETCPYPWIETIEEGDFVVIDQSGLRVGLMGSANLLDCLSRGMRGLVTNGGVRDTDEVILEKIPVWCSTIAQSTVHLRLEYSDMDIPVAVGGVQVRPGDVIVADGDGVVVVPQEIAFEVAELAKVIHDMDKEERRRLYDKIGRPYDETVL